MTDLPATKPSEVFVMSCSSPIGSFSPGAAPGHKGITAAGSRAATVKAIKILKLAMGLSCEVRGREALELAALDDFQFAAEVLEGASVHGNVEEDDAYEDHEDDDGHALLGMQNGERFRGMQNGELRMKNGEPILRFAFCVLRFFWLAVGFHGRGAAGETARKVNSGRMRPGLMAPLARGWSSSSQRQAATFERGSEMIEEVFTLARTGTHG